MPRRDIRLAQKLGRNQKTILELMSRHGGVYPYSTRHVERLILRTLQRRGLVTEVDGTWHLDMSAYRAAVDVARLR